ncbi:unnamed protein product [Pelagomonas calceolata]|uniref:TFIIS N-terminal domain-containing protein n=1 Tax=Pelagomonas calceolata TaxID=35677 RepID=A0A8J2WQ82_9STRA|nr:unnamed protein product [Pelagomonas calceolata]|mmetsp:Transcript_2713/g.7880  ORF Transcript_2713/g.7880 Transcript_2713/m.7880 type:complete len:592 (+) Transcript_2713:124-1899(+)
MAEVASSAPAPAGETPAAEAPAPDAAASREAAPMDVDDNSSEDPILVSLESEAKHVAHAPLVDPDAVEMRLLPLLDSEGRLQDGTEVGARVHALCEKIPRDAETTKGVLLVVLRRTCALVEKDNGKKLAMRAFLNAGGLRPLGTWLERADKERSDDFVRLLLDALSDLPVTARLVKASDVGKIVKRLKKDRKESGDQNMDSAYKGLMQNWYEKANKGDDEEERKLVALEAQARKATEKKKRSAKKRSSQPTDVLASALHQKKRAKVPDEAMDRSRAARIEARRQGRLGGGVETLQLAHESNVAFDDDGQPITSRPIDPELAERLAKRTTRVKWADDNGKEIASYCEPVEGWLDDGGHHGPSADDGLTAKERQKKEREMEARALGKAKELENAEKKAEEVEYQRKLDAQKPQIAWREPPPLKLGEDVAEPEVVATEPATQASRQKRLMEARYFHARDIPDNPADDGMETFRLDSSTVEIPAQELEKQPEEVVAEPEPAPPPVPAPPPQDVWTAPTPQFTPSFGGQQQYYPPPPPRAANAPRGLPEAITRLDEDALRFLLQNQALYDSLFVEGELDESRLRDVIANFRRGPRR